MEAYNILNKNLNDLNYENLSDKMKVISSFSIKIAYHPWKIDSNDM